MKFQLSQTPYVKVCKLLKIELSPKEKFDRLTRKIQTKGSKLRKYHFNLIPHGGSVILFDGLGNEFGTYSFDVRGIRSARIFALELFQESKNQNGGYSVTAPTMDFLTQEEMTLVKKQTSNLLNYNPFIVCKDCRFQFESEKELRNHRCGKTWAILEFRKVA